MERKVRESEQAWALVPVKSLTVGKSRLDAVLSSEQRTALVEAMLEDVLAALKASAAVARTFVVTPDPHIDRIARSFGAEVLRETVAGGYCRSVKDSALRLEELGAERLLVIPADVPLIEPAEIAAVVLACESNPSVALVPATADGGTNAICAFPPNAIDFRFGERSFEAHCAAARERGIAPRILALLGFALDIDRPADLRALANAMKPSRCGIYARTVLALPGSELRFDAARDTTDLSIGS